MKNYFYLLLSVITFFGCQQEHATVKPNIILILADDLGYNDLSSYRKLNQTISDKPPTTQTPHLDRLAARGIKFTNFYAGAAVCSPSRSALLTGRNATRVGIYNWIPNNSPMHLRDQEVTIAEMLKQDNYRTGHFGKWHLTSEGTDQPLPNDQGFDYSFYTYNNAQPSHYNPVNFFRNGDAVGELEGYACQLVVDEALKWLDNSKKESEPFYINIWFNEPHEKIAAPPKLVDRHYYRSDYYGAIENLDSAVGRVQKYLIDNDLDQNTMVIFTSDNGSQVAASNDPFRGEKCFNFEGGVRAPFIVSWPGKTPQGTTSDVTGSFTDVLPTIASLTDSNLPDNQLDGVDLSEIFQGEEKALDRESPVFFYRYFHDPVSMLRQDEWVLLGFEAPMPYQKNYNPVRQAKLKPEPEAPQWSMWGFQPLHMEYIENQEINHFELYNIVEDPEQKNDIASRYPDKVMEMKEKMLELKAEMLKEGGNWFKQD